MLDDTDDDAFWAHADDPNGLLARWLQPTAARDRLDEHTAISDEDRDPLTQLPTAGAAEAHLARIAPRIRTGLDVVAVVAIDLDAFAEVNAMYGRAVGDAVLKIVAERLKFDRGAKAFRIDDDLFAVVVDWLGSRLDVVALAQRVQTRVSRPCIAGGHIIRPSACAGVRSRWTAGSNRSRSSATRSPRSDEQSGAGRARSACGGATDRLTSPG